MVEFIWFLAKVVGVLVAVGTGVLLTLYAVVYIAAWMGELKHSVKIAARKRGNFAAKKAADADAKAEVVAAEKAVAGPVATPTTRDLSKMDMAELEAIVETGTADEAVRASKLMEARCKLMYQMSRFKTAKAGANRGTNGKPPRKQELGGEGSASPSAPPAVQASKDGPAPTAEADDVPWVY